MKYGLRIVLGLTVLLFMTLEIEFIQIPNAEEADYVGVAKCKLCHMKPYAVWSGSKHAKAFEALKPAEQKDPKCLGCHVTGYPTTNVATDERLGVQCEACHGPASLYIKMHPKKDKEGARKAGMIAKPDSAVCRNCHNEKSPFFKGFDYAQMWEKIKHPK